MILFIVLYVEGKVCAALYIYVQLDDKSEMMVSQEKRMGKLLPQ